MTDPLASVREWADDWSTAAQRVPGTARMEIDVADAEALRSLKNAATLSWEADAIDRIVAAIPTPPWEPDREAVSAYAASCGEVNAKTGYASGLRWLHERGWHLVKDSDG